MRAIVRAAIATPVTIESVKVALCSIDTGDWSAHPIVRPTVDLSLALRFPLQHFPHPHRIHVPSDSSDTATAPNLPVVRPVEHRVSGAPAERAPGGQRLVYGLFVPDRRHGSPPASDREVGGTSRSTPIPPRPRRRAPNDHGDQHRRARLLLPRAGIERHGGAMTASAPMDEAPGLDGHARRTAARPVGTIGRATLKEKPEVRTGGSRRRGRAPVRRGWEQVA
jgi:hypothetical protein